jgi:hypothetical protein
MSFRANSCLHTVTKPLRFCVSGRRKTCEGGNGRAGLTAARGRTRSAAACRSLHKFTPDCRHGLRRIVANVEGGNRAKVRQVLPGKRPWRAAAGISAMGHNRTQVCIGAISSAMVGRSMSEPVPTCLAT